MGNKLLRVLVIAVVGAVVAAAAVAFAPAPARLTQKDLLSPEYRQLLAQAQTAPVRVIIGVKTANPGAKKADLQASRSARAAIIAAEPGLQVNPTSLDWAIPFVSARVDAATLQRLHASPLVTSISMDHQNRLLDAGSDALIGAPAAWAMGLLGTNEAVAILDTGVQSAHPFFGSRVVGQACFTGDGSATTPPLYSNCPGGAASAVGSPAGEPCYNYPAYAGCEHGTHVAGDAAGNGFYAGGSGFGGVAIQAPILAVQVFTCSWNGSTCIEVAYDTDVISALNWVYSQPMPIAAVNLSAGVTGSDYTTACDSVNSAMTAAFGLLKSDKGIAVVVGTGNDGYTDGINYPACISTAISVAAVDNSDTVASFADVGPNAKLFAPGVNVSSSIPGGGYAIKSGTSIAAPHVAGAWSLLKQKNPSATVDQILAELTTTGKAITVPATTRTIPRIQLSAVLGRQPVVDATSRLQYTLAGSNGTTWISVDTTSLTPLILSFVSSTSCRAVLSANADLWTANAGYNQDLGIAVSGGAYPTIAGQPEAWKESGGFAGTFSPNAAYVQTVITLAPGVTYTATLVWKANKPDPGTIFIGAGPIASTYSPTHLTAQLMGCG